MRPGRPHPVKRAAVARPAPKGHAGRDARRWETMPTAVAGHPPRTGVSAGHAPATQTAVRPGPRPEAGRAAGRRASPSGLPALDEAPIPGVSSARGASLASSEALVPIGARPASGALVPIGARPASGALVPIGARPASGATSGALAPSAILASDGRHGPARTAGRGGVPLAPAGHSGRALRGVRPAGAPVTVTPSAQAPGGRGPARIRARREARGTRRTAGAVPSARYVMTARAFPGRSTHSSSTPRPGPS